MITLVIYINYLYNLNLSHIYANKKSRHPALG
jgi:hypothetical protein